MKSFAFAAIAAVASARISTETDFQFINYIAQHSKSYADWEEFSIRLERFRAIDADIKEFNATEESSVHGHNFLSDWTAEEKTRLMGLKNMARPQKEVVEAVEIVGIPTTVDWVTAGNYVNPVQNQGSCGSCWAFAAAATMESAHAIFHSGLIKLSEQNFVSCSGLQGNNGCNGGLQQYAWNYSKSHPIETEANYPYTSGTLGITGSCKYNSSLGVMSATSHTSVGTTTAAIKTAIYKQPQSVSIEADTSYFQSYTSGVLTNASKCGSNLDHAVTAVGYGVDSTYGGYYLVRNSWGASWGESGYVKIGQAAGNGVCGINEDVKYPNVN